MMSRNIGARNRSGLASHSSPPLSNMINPNDGMITAGPRRSHRNSTLGFIALSGRPARSIVLAGSSERWPPWPSLAIRTGQDRCQPDPSRAPVLERDHKWIINNRLRMGQERDFFAVGENSAQLETDRPNSAQ